MKSDLEWAWVAGIFEGEGCINFVRKNSVQLCISMTDKDVVERVVEITKVGSCRESRYRKPGYKPYFRWSIGKVDEVLEFLDKVDLYLGKRRWKKAQEAKQRLTGVRKPGFCKRGHQLDDETRYVSPKGKTECLICSREKAREHYRLSHKCKVKGSIRKCDSCGSKFVARSPTHKYCNDHSEWSKRKVI